MRQFGERMHRADLHFARDAPGAHVERAAEDERKAEHVVDLVRIVRAPGDHDQVPARGVRELGTNLGIGIGEREHHRPAGHGLEHLRGQQVRGRDAHEHVGIAQRVGERTQARGMRELALVDIKVVACRVDHALAVHQGDVFLGGAECDQQAHGSNAGGTGAEADDAGVGNFLALKFECV